MLDHCVEAHPVAEGEKEQPIVSEARHPSRTCPSRRQWSIRTDIIRSLLIPNTYSLNSQPRYVPVVKDEEGTENGADSTLGIKFVRSIGLKADKKGS